MTVREISTVEMQAFVTKHHYSATMPRHTKVCYGGFRDETLRGAISFGWGSRPVHTIRRLFPSLGTADYRDIGKMCVHDDEPKNTESQFMAEAFRRLQRKMPNLSVIFTWADGILGKPGYVYQASNFLYGGFIWTEVYQMEDGQRVNPLQLQKIYARVGLKTSMRTQRPTSKEMVQMGWKHFRGKQFRYVKFLCARDLQAVLLRESPFTWTTNYPKHADLEWKTQEGGKWVTCPQPRFTGTV